MLILYYILNKIKVDMIMKKIIVAIVGIILIATCSVSVNAGGPIASIGDFVWEDLNKNGIQDSGELGIENVLVELYNSSNVLIDDTLTDSAGFYIFVFFYEDIFYLKFYLPENYIFTSQDIGDDTTDSDVDIITGETEQTEIIYFENDMTWDAGMYQEDLTEDYEGLTPGYWKNHEEDWQGYEINDDISEVFNLPASIDNIDTTLLNGLKFKGGKGIEGAARILLRSAIAALLNAEHELVNYPLNPNEVITDVNNALASLDRSTMLDLKDLLDEYNNLGCFDL
jgi:hypothetical protein